MSVPTIFVPIQLDALVLQRTTSVVEAMADFSRLPYTDGTRDYRSGVAPISEEILSQPLESKNLNLKPGIHLHWSLPAALTRSDEHGVFPPVPNRWLITRKRRSSSGSPETERQWVVESDFLHPDGKGDDAGGIPIPFPPAPEQGRHRPFRYLGRTLPLDRWNTLQTQPNRDDEYLADRTLEPGPLTAVGYGEPAFAALYSNCHGVLGSYDPDQSDPDPALQYDVVGWYSNATLDPVYAFFQEHTAVTDASEWKTLFEEQFNWTFADVPPRRLVCYARLNFTTTQITKNPALDEALAVAVGHTRGEAVIAYQASVAERDAKRRQQLHARLRAAVVADRVEHRRLDRGAKFEEACHADGFSATTEGSLWMVNRRPTAGVADTETQEPTHQSTLPDALADLLNEANETQEAYDRAWLEIRGARRQLFSDWYKYMITLYPSDYSLREVVDPNLAREYIRTRRLVPLQQRIANTGTLYVQQDDQGLITGARAGQPGDAGTSLAADLAARLNALIQAVTEFNQTLAANKAPFQIGSTARPRYWSPNEPVVLLVGPATGVRERPDVANTPLACTVTPLSNDAPAGANDVNALGECVEQIHAVDPDGPAFQRWQFQPWRPFLLEWEVEVFPVREKSNAGTADRNYQSDFIRENYTLAEDAVDLRLKEGKGALVRGANLYRGANILSPGAHVELRQKLGAYLSRATAKQNEAVRSITEAYENLANTNGLAQSLGGFNAALLMHKQTLQLAVQDPLNFAEQKKLADNVASAIGSEIDAAPQPLNDFNPIRSGAFQLQRLRLVDAFGQTQDIDLDRIIIPPELQLADDPKLMALPPRLMQDARLNLRWRSARADAGEMNAHPATSPVCGWMIGNHLDESLLFYDAEGLPVGLIDRWNQWRNTPGDSMGQAPAALENEHLSRVVQYLLRQAQTNEDFLPAFRRTVDDALEAIEPEDLAGHPVPAAFMGRPLAIVRASVELQVSGRPMIDQSWPAFQADLTANDDGAAQTHGWTGVEFPVRLGEDRQLGDGLVGYWIEADDGRLADVFYAPQSAASAGTATQELIRTHTDGEPLNLHLSVNDPRRTVTMLFDPRGRLHAIPGVLPAKSIDIPPDQYVHALQQLEVTFFSSPILSDRTQLKIPLADEPGFQWSWVENQRDGWTEVSRTGVIAKKDFLKQFQRGAEIWRGLLGTWLQAIDDATARIIAREQRESEPDFGEEPAEVATAFSGQREDIERLFEQSCIGLPSLEAHFADARELREGWLKLRRNTQTTQTETQ